MTLLSAFDDFMQRTLKTIPGLPAKLLYLSELRNAEGQYEHWGLQEAHGRDRAMQAISYAHALLIREMTHASVSTLYDELYSASSYLEKTTDELIAKLQSKEILPANTPAFTRAHINSIVGTLGRLLHANVVPRIQAA